MTMTQKIVFSGPESCGKSSLSAWLSRQLPNNILLPEYTRLYCEEHGVDTDLVDVEQIALGQIAQEKMALAQEPQWLIMDSDLVSNWAWSMTLFGEVPDVIVDALQQPFVGHYFLGEPIGMVWENDPMRCQPDLADRVAFFQLCQGFLIDNNLPFTVLKGDYAKRCEQVLAELNHLK